MADQAAIQNQFSYKATSNLVLNPERRNTNDGEATGEVESLWGNFGNTRMGDRVANSRPKELEEKLEKMKKRREEKAKRKGNSRKVKASLETADTITSSNFDIDNSMYRPKTRETRNVFSLILAMLTKRVGDVQQEILRDTADEVLSVLKNDTLRDNERQGLVEDLVGKMPADEYSNLVQYAAMITDYVPAEEDEGDKLDDELGLAVVLDEDDDDDDSDAEFEIGEEEDDEFGEDTEMTDVIGGGAGDDEDVDMEDAEDDVDPTTIDAHWLQRTLSKYYPDALVAKQLASDVLGHLEHSVDDRDCENKLVELLEYDKFDVIKLLLRNRLKIVYCTRWATAQTDKDKEAIAAEMADNDELADILAVLEGKARPKTTSGNQSVIRHEGLRTRKLGGGARANTAAAAEGSARNSSGEKLLDLDAMAFHEGSHLMANKKATVPQGSKRIPGKGYEEVHVPAKKAPPMTEDLVPIDSLPEWTHPAFKGMAALNRLQSKVYPAAFGESKNLLICAPTGAGKTNVALLTILNTIGRYRDEGGVIDKAAFKIVYIAPMKSLVQEMVGNFGARLAPFGITVAELSGDNQLTKSQIAETQVIVTTPEKWDIVTRKSGDRTYTQLVRLVIIDEIHLLHDERGCVLESIVARTIRQVETTQEMIRIVGLSATLPNYEDVATFIRAEDGVFHFDNSYRPCPLQQVYVGVKVKRPLQRFQLMNEITYEKVIEQAGKNQVLVFCHSRKETGATARFIRDKALENDTLGRFLKEDSASREILQTEVDSCASSELADLLPYGFAMHHAGMKKEDRNLVEDLFGDGHIQVLVSTATLAWGVNLPAYAVIIKGTQVYSPEKGRWVELSPLDVMQMLGRAGRPSYDTRGLGIVITTHTELQYYLSLLNEQLPIESQFLTKLADNLNAEIVLGTVTTVDEAVTWLGYTYLYVRMLDNPALYSISPATKAADPLLVQHRRDLIHSAATVLDRANLIRYDRRSGAFLATDLGRVASGFYITHASMAVYRDHLKPSMSDIDLFRLFALSAEFKFIVVRQEERIELAKLLERVPIPVKETVEDAAAKTNVLLQTYISHLKLDGFAMVADMVYITQSAGRIMRALFEIVLKRGWAQLALKILNLCKMINRRMWLSQTPLRQFRGVPEDMLRKIEKKAFPWERFYDLSPQEIGELVRFQQFGKPLYKLVHQFPRLELAAQVQPITRSVLKVELTITPDFRWETSIHGGAEPFWILVEDVDGEEILHHEFFVLKARFCEDDHIVTFTVPIYEPLPPQYFIRVVSDRWLQCETVLPVSFRHLFLPNKNLPPTELLDLSPIPVSALRNPAYEAVYADAFTYFNPIQTQVFNTVYGSDDNVLVCAPTGSGKTVIAEFALLRMFAAAEASGTPCRAVYIAPLQAIADTRMADWREKFGGKLGKRVVQLTGEAAADAKLLKAGDIVISTPERWDVISRRWRQRKNVQTVSVFIVDELHLVGSASGPVVEVITSRMRYISSQLKKHTIRIVGLATSIANARDVGDWLGAKASAIYNFPTSVRPVPLEIHLRGFDMSSFMPRILAMTKPTFTAITAHSPDKPVLVFVPSRKLARMVAIDLVTYAVSEGGAAGGARFLHAAPADIEPHLGAIQESGLAETLSKGVGFYHEGLSSREKGVVSSLFSAGAVQVVVVSSGECWGVDLSAHLVVIMDTQRYDGREHRYVDYPIPDVLQMMGRATRPLVDDGGKCFILCQASKKDYYKRFLYEPLPVESHLDLFLHDHLVAEVVTRTITSMEDAVNYLTWSFLYRRLTQNPNYYALQGVSNRHLSDYLSDLIETVVGDLDACGCVAIEDEIQLSALNLGIIASYYYIRYTTIELFASSVTAKTKLMGLLEIVAAASEFDTLPSRHGEEHVLKRLAHRVPGKLPSDVRLSEPSAKANVLLQAHFSRLPLSRELEADSATVVSEVLRLIQALVDVTLTNGWLNPALAAMELSQMVVQAMWAERDSQLKQLPHFTQDVVARCTAAGIESVFDLIDMEDDERVKLLGMSGGKLADVTRACNRYPSIEVEYSVVDASEVSAGGAVEMSVQLEREIDEDEHVGPVIAPFYPKPKEEGWWLVVGNTSTNTVYVIKRVSVAAKASVELAFTAPEEGTHNLTLFFMCDSYLGCDQEYEFDLVVGAAEESSSDSDDSDDGDAMED